MDAKTQTADPGNLLKMTSEIVAAHVGKTSTKSQEIADLLTIVHAKLKDLSIKGANFETQGEPAVPIDESIYDDYLICLEDGRKMKMLKRHLNTVFGLSPDQYRAKWGLAADYPMVAPNYALKRQELAKKIGLGKRRAA